MPRSDLPTLGRIGDLTGIRRAVENYGVDINETHRDSGSTALHHILSKENTLHCIPFFFEDKHYSNVNFNLKDKFGRTPLISAAIFGVGSTVRLYLSHMFKKSEEAGLAAMSSIENSLQYSLALESPIALWPRLIGSYFSSFAIHKLPKRVIFLFSSISPSITDRISEWMLHKFQACLETTNPADLSVALSAYLSHYHDNPLKLNLLKQFANIAQGAVLPISDYIEWNPGLSLNVVQSLFGLISDRKDSTMEKTFRFVMPLNAALTRKDYGPSDKLIEVIQWLCHQLGQEGLLSVAGSCFSRLASSECIIDTMLNSQEFHPRSLKSIALSFVKNRKISYTPMTLIADLIDELENPLNQCRKVFLDSSTLRERLEERIIPVISVYNQLAIKNNNKRILTLQTSSLFHAYSWSESIQLPLVHAILIQQGLISFEVLLKKKNRTQMIDWFSRMSRHSGYVAPLLEIYSPVFQHLQSKSSKCILAMELPRNSMLSEQEREALIEKYGQK